MTDAASNLPKKSRRRRGDGRPTIADVAARAGVGAITVSRALRDPSLVSEPLRRSIDDAVRELNYIPNFSARALARHRSDVLGVLVPSLSQVVFTDVLRGIYDGVDGTVLQVQIANTRYNRQEEERLIETFLRQKPAAMIVSGVDQTPRARRMLESSGCPVIQIMDLTADPIDEVIGFSHVAAGRRATEHLIGQGYRRIAFLKGWTSKRANGRYLGYREALSAAGLEEPVEANGTYDNPAAHVAEHLPATIGLPMRELASTAMGRELLRQALATDPAIDAVFCNNDILALGVLFECMVRGIRVPQDMGIVGFNDHEYMAAAEPALSSVRTPRYECGVAAVRAVRRKLDGETGGASVNDLGTEVMVRASTMRAPGRAGPEKSAAAIRARARQSTPS
jgi:LacI family gluconate utilization system Gnt-I transcriptional repressor